MAEITRLQYEYALERIEELLPYIGNNVPASDKHMVEMDIVTDIVNRYEAVHFPIKKLVRYPASHTRPGAGLLILQ